MFGHTGTVVSGFAAMHSRSTNAIRQWLVNRFDLWDQELAETTNFIFDDVRNNSAWNQRYFVLTRRPSGLDADAIKSEIEFCFSKIQLTPHNESPWNYLRRYLFSYQNTLCLYFWRPQ